MAGDYREFGQLMKGLRIESGTTLRRFCDQHGFDIETLSRVERGIYPPPEERDKLTEYAEALGVQRGSTTWVRFFDLAARAERSDARMEAHRAAVTDRLPILFRTQNNRELDNETLDEVARIVRDS